MKILTNPGQKAETILMAPDPLPLWMSKHLYPFGTAEFCKGDFGNFLTQATKTQDFTLHFFRFEITAAVTLYPVTETPVTGLLCMLKGSAAWLLPGYGKNTLEEATCELFY